MTIDTSNINIVQMVKDRVNNIADKEFPITSFGFETILRIDKRFYTIDIKVALAK